MPLFHRQHDRDPPAVVAPVPGGTLPCIEQGCAHQTALQCRYVDRRGRRCPAAFCPEHWSQFSGVVYCRRHASTLRALGNAEVSAGSLPELENRGPSLISWIGRELTTPIGTLLGSVAAPTESVLSDLSVVVIHDQHRRRRWERSWKLVAHTGVTIKVDIHVAEGEDDALVEARVNGRVVAGGIPPWIARRRAGDTVTDEVDSEQRRLFRMSLLDPIAEEVHRQHGDEHLGAGSAQAPRD